MNFSLFLFKGFLVLLCFFVQVTSFSQENIEERAQDTVADTEIREVMSFESYLQKLTSIPNIIERRDPFETKPHPYMKKFSEIDREIDIKSAPPLQRFPAKNYIVKAVLLGQGTPRALVSAPSIEKKTWIVKIGSSFGNRGGKINKINKKGLYVVEDVINSEGEKAKIELELEIGKKEERK